MTNSTNEKRPATWPDLAMGLYDRLTGRGAEITYEFDDLHVAVPSDAASSGPSADWRLHGAVRIRTRDTRQS